MNDVGLEGPGGSKWVRQTMWVWQPCRLTSGGHCRRHGEQQALLAPTWQKHTPAAQRSSIAVISNSGGGGRRSRNRLTGATGPIGGRSENQGLLT